MAPHQHRELEEFADVRAGELVGFLATLDRLVGRLGDEDFAALRKAAIERWPSSPAA